ncbi:hypothetical protein [Flavobacterium saliperosum]|uniref:Uncharacterized protein n=1 Tax=Flavobacterium saliperosum TaxID=329186 RepID=A0A1G4W0I0_9FLAO|nr:hypothetical protein [Flavobacterium saliperosum]SCX14825.1 hypothetical protein SAMN02927925_02134 [Flavobacterium saliperosum]
MLKRLAITLLFFIACVVNLGHSLFPHSHVVEHHHNHDGQHHHHHHHDEKSQESGIALFFSHFNHNSDNFTKGHFDEEVRFVCTNNLQAIITNVAGIDLEVFFNVSEVPIKTFKEPFVFISPHLESLTFRGPPSFFS